MPYTYSISYIINSLTIVELVYKWLWSLKLVYVSYIKRKYKLLIVDIEAIL